MNFKHFLILCPGFEHEFLFYIFWGNLPAFKRKHKNRGGKRSGQRPLIQTHGSSLALLSTAPVLSVIVFPPLPGKQDILYIKKCYSAFEFSGKWQIFNFHKLKKKFGFFCYVFKLFLPHTDRLSDVVVSSDWAPQWTIICACYLAQNQ